MDSPWQEAVWDVLGDIGVGVAVGDTDKFSYVNHAFCAITGYTTEELASVPPLDLIAPAHLDTARECIERRLGGESLPDLYRLALLRPDGTQAVIEGATRVVEVNDQRQLVAAVRDVTERVRAEEARLVGEERFRLLVEGIDDYAFFLLDPGGRVVSWNTGAERLKGYQAEEVMGRYFSRFLPLDEVTGGAGRALSIAAAAGTYTGEGLCPRKDGSEFWASFTITALRADHDALRGFAVLVHDITGPKMARQALERSHLEERAWRERLEALQNGVLEAQEQERRHIARELHDEIGQALTALKLTLDRLERTSVEGQGVLLADAHRVVGALVAQVQDLSLELRPAMLDDLGLLAALLWLLDRYATQTQLKVGFEHDGLEQRFSSQVETTVYRIVQEALTNVARHAAVERASVSCRVNGRELVVEVADRGVGFRPEETRGVGLLGIEERVRLVGGWVSVESEPYGGTRLLAGLPIDSGLG